VPNVSIQFSAHKIQFKRINS